MLDFRGFYDPVGRPTFTRENKKTLQPSLPKKKKILQGKLHRVLVTPSWVNSIHSAETSGKGGKYFFAGLGPAKLVQAPAASHDCHTRYAQGFRGILRFGRHKKKENPCVSLRTSSSSPSEVNCFMPVDI